MNFPDNRLHVPKLATGIAGFDLIAKGGLPKGRATLVTGTAGSAKTVFAVQFLAEGIQKAGESGVFVTLEESPEDLRKNLASFGWTIQKWEAEGKWVFVDASPQPVDAPVISGDFDFGALMSRIDFAIQKVAAKRISLDGLGAVFTQFTDSATVRRELFRIAAALKRIGVTAVMTVERGQEQGEIARHGVEEFVADNVIVLSNVLEEEKRRRTLEILKFRGASHQKGEVPFTIIPAHGIVVIPFCAIELKQKSSVLRITSGNHELDKMCGGGFFRDSIILLSGPTGTGKTLLETQFLAAGIANGERCLVFALEESREQLFRNAMGWGVDFGRMEQEGKLKVICNYPEAVGLEDHLLNMMTTIDEFKPNRVAVDSLSALERVATTKGFREFVIGLTAFIKHQEIAGLFTASTPTLMGGSSPNEVHLYTITDSIILFRYVEIYGEMRRGLAVLKMRGSAHDKDIREFVIDSKGVHIGKPFRNVTGILAGNPTHIAPDELKRMGELFDQEILA